MTDFQKIHTKCHKNPSSGSWVVPRGQTDRHDEASSLFSQFFNMPENIQKFTDDTEEPYA